MDYLNNNFTDTQQSISLDTKKPSNAFLWGKIISVVICLAVSAVNPKLFLLGTAGVYIVWGVVIYLATKRVEIGKLIAFIAAAVYHVLLFITIPLTFKSSEPFTTQNLIIMIVGEAFFALGFYKMVYSHLDGYYLSKRLTQTVEAEVVDVYKTTKTMGDDSHSITIDVYYPILSYELYGRVYREKSNRYRDNPPFVGEKYKIKVNPNKPKEFNDNEVLYSVPGAVLSIPSILFLLVFCAVWLAPWFAFPKINELLGLINKTND